MHSTPDISIIIPTYNRAHYLEKAIKCCQAQIGNFEIIISDNCSIDNTRDIVQPFLKDPRIRYFRNDHNLGMMGNWKKCIYEHSLADWFVLMSDDDYFTDNTYLRDAWDAIIQYNPKLVYAGGRIVKELTGKSENLILPFSGLVSGQQIFKSRGTVKPQDFILSNVVFNKKDAARFNFPRNSLNLSSDSEFFLNLCTEGNVFSINRCVIDYTVHDNNFVSKISKVKELYISNNDHLIYPYLLAIEKNIPQSTIKGFIKNSNMKKIITNTLINLKLNNIQWHDEYRNYLKKVIPNLLNEIESSFYFQKKKLKAYILKNHYKNKFKLRELLDNDS